MQAKEGFVVAQESAGGQSGVMRALGGAQLLGAFAEKMGAFQPVYPRSVMSKGSIGNLIYISPGMS